MKSRGTCWVLAIMLSAASGCAMDVAESPEWGVEDEEEATLQSELRRARRHRGRVLARLTQVASELEDLDHYLRDARWDDGRTNCRQLRTGWNLPATLDMRRCISNRPRRIRLANCAEVPRVTDGHAALWMRRCATSDAMIALWRSIRCDEIGTRVKQNYQLVRHHVAARKCGLNERRHCRYRGSRYLDGDLFVAYDAASAGVCESVAREYRCNHGRIEGVGHSRFPQSLTCFSNAVDRGFMAGGGDDSDDHAEALFDRGLTVTLSTHDNHTHPPSGPGSIHDEIYRPTAGFAADDRGFAHAHEDGVTVWHVGDGFFFEHDDLTDEERDSFHEELEDSHDEDLTNGDFYLY